MDAERYKAEIDQIEKTANNMTSDQSSLSSANAIYKYKYYILSSLGIFLGLLLVKPKVVLQITSENNKPEMTVNVRKFLSWWLLLSLVCFIGLYFFSKYKSG